MGPPLNLKTKEESCAAAINAGTDLEMGTDYWNSSMISAVKKGLVTETTVTEAAYRGILQRLRQGDFDPIIPPPPPPAPRNCSLASMVHGSDTDFGSYIPGALVPPTPSLLPAPLSPPDICYGCLLSATCYRLSDQRQRRAKHRRTLQGPMLRCRGM